MSGNNYTWNNENSSGVSGPPKFTTASPGTPMQRPPAPNSVPNGPYFGQPNTQFLTTASHPSVPSDPSLNTIAGGYRPGIPQPDSIPRNNSAPNVGNAAKPPDAVGGLLTNGVSYPNSPGNIPLQNIRPAMPVINGPGDPQQRLGPQGQMMNRSVSSPPVSGPIALTPIAGQAPPPPQSPDNRSSMYQQPQLHLNHTYPPSSLNRPPGPPPSGPPPPPSGPPTGRPGELPMPYHGQGQYSHQVRAAGEAAGLTPGSEPVSQKSSRNPSPVPNVNFDALEGQFTPTPGAYASQSTASPFPAAHPPLPVPSSTPAPPTLSPTGAPMMTPSPRHTQPFSQSLQTASAQPSIMTSAPPVSYHPGVNTSMQPPASAALPPPGMTSSPPATAGARPSLTTSRYPQMPGAYGGQQAPAPLSGPPARPLGPNAVTNQPTGSAATGQFAQMSGAVSPPAPHQFAGQMQSAPPPPGMQPPPPPPGGMHPTALPGHGYPAPPTSQGYPQAPPTSQGYPQAPPTSQGYPQAPPTSQGYPQASPTSQGYSQAPPTSQGYPQGPPTLSNAGRGNSYDNSQVNTASLAQGFSNMNVQPDVTRPLNLLQEKCLIPREGMETVIPNLPADYKQINCSPDIFRCTLNALPNSSNLLSKCRLPLGILIHPFKDLTDNYASGDVDDDDDDYSTTSSDSSFSEDGTLRAKRVGDDYTHMRPGFENLSVIQTNVIVRCRSCRTYINPFVSFVDSRRWKCNLCFRNNDLPDEFSYDPVSKTYGDPQRRPEIKSSTIEFIAPSEYMLRPPQAAEYLFVLDVSFNAIETGYLKLFCETLLEELDRLPGDGRTRIGFMTYSTSVHYFNLAEGLSQPQMLVVSDIDDVFLPLPEGLLVNVGESRELISDLLTNLPGMFDGVTETSSALGAALQAAFKLMGPTGGRVSVFQTLLPTVGPGALKSREDPNLRSGKKIQHMGPAIDFYKKLALDCSAQQVAVDLFMLNSQYADLASISGISKYSGGSLHYFPGMHAASNPAETDRFVSTLRRYVTRKIGFESVMRIRCSRGISIHTFHGNFFVRSTDLLSLPNVNPEAGFGMQMSIEDNIETNYFSFQAALLYTSSRGERRIRVHTLCLPVTSSITEVFAGADQQAITCLLAKMAVERSITGSLGDARDALVNAVVDMLGAYGTTLTSSQRMGQLPCPYNLRFMPAYALALLKFMAFRTGTSTRLDDRINAMELCKNLPLCYLLQEIYPDLYPVHNLDDKDAINQGDLVVPQPPRLHLSSAYLDRHGAYVMDSHRSVYLWISSGVSDVFCQQVFDVPNYHQVPDGPMELPELENETSERLRTFINYLFDQKPVCPMFFVIRENSKERGMFLSRLIEDRAESTFSYYEFLQHLQKEVK